MAHTKKEEWIEVQEAAAILSLNSGHTIVADYVRVLAHKGHIEMKPKDARQNLYLKSDVEAYRVRKNKQVQAPPIAPYPGGEKVEK